MGSKLNDNDAKALFAVADEDNSGTLSIDEFFTNFRHDKWTREKFFWNTQAGGNSSLNLNRNQRHELVKKIDYDSVQKPAWRSTADIMRVIDDKVAARGSTRHAFRSLDKSHNGSIEVDEIAGALQPYEISVGDDQAAEILATINKIAGMPPETELTYNSFAQAFNSRLPPEQMGSIAFQPPRDSELVRRREPIEAQPSCLFEGEVRTLEGPRSSDASLDTYDMMRSMSTLPVAPRIDRSAWNPKLSEAERKAEQDAKPRYDMMGGWRGNDGMANDTGGWMGTEIMKTGRDINWYAFDNKDNDDLNGIYAQKPTTHMHKGPRAPFSPRTTLERPMLLSPRSAAIAAAGSGARPAPMGPPMAAEEFPMGGDARRDSNGSRLSDAATTHGDGESDSPPRRARRNSGGSGSAVGGAGGDARRDSDDSSTKQINWMMGDPNELQRTFVPDTKMPTRLDRASRSRLHLAHELTQSRSTMECITPDADSHYHMKEQDRFAHTSSIASLRSISSAHSRPLRDPRQVQQSEWAEIKRRENGERQKSRQARLQASINAIDRRTQEIDDARVRNRADFTKRFGERQLLNITRNMENGLAPVVVETPPHSKWVPAPPHLTSHWKSISGHLRDPPPRESAGIPKIKGRKMFPPRGPDPRDAHPNKAVWGGAHYDHHIAAGRSSGQGGVGRDAL